MKRVPDRLKQLSPRERSRQQWISRALITFFLLCPGAEAMQSAGGGWVNGIKLLLFGGGLLFWHCVAGATEAERQSGLSRTPQRSWTAGRYGFAAGLIAAIAMMGMALHGFQSLSAILYFPAFILLVYILELLLASKRSREDLLEAREQALRAKLAPHFIFNTLNTLHAQIESDPRGAQATTERLAALFRQVIEASDQAVIPLKQELAFVEAYLGIEQARLGERLRVRVEVPEELESASVPPLSLQVLVENAVKHGIAPLEDGGEIHISAKREGTDLVIEVGDPGTGIGAQPGTGTALETLRARLVKPEDLTLARVDGRTVASFRWRQP